MLLTLMLLAVPVPVPVPVPDPETAIDAERAFNRAAQTEGQWTAFRKFSTPDAVIFTPQPAKAHDVLPQRDPKIAIQWWPAESYVSCDGMVAVNTGPWMLPKAVGYFTTVWVRQNNGHYKWVYDGGDSLASPRALPEKPKVRTASCSGSPIMMMSTVANGTTQHGYGESPDRTLKWFWAVDAKGNRTFEVELWNGKTYETALANKIAAPK